MDTGTQHFSLFCLQLTMDIRHSSRSMIEMFLVHLDNWEVIQCIHLEVDAILLLQESE